MLQSATKAPAFSSKTSKTNQLNKAPTLTMCWAHARKSLSLSPAQLQQRDAGEDPARATRCSGGRLPRENGLDAIQPRLLPCLRNAPVSGDDANIARHCTDLPVGVTIRQGATGSSRKHLQPHVDHGVLHEVHQRRQQMAGIERDRECLGGSSAYEAVPASEGQSRDVRQRRVSAGRAHVSLC